LVLQVPSWVPIDTPDWASATERLSNGALGMRTGPTEVVRAPDRSSILPVESFQQVVISMALFGFNPSGQICRGPAADVIGLVLDGRFPHTGILFRPEHRGVAEWISRVESDVDYLEDGYVDGLVELAHHDVTAGVFVYPTGEGPVLADVLAQAARSERHRGVRAGLELMHGVGSILVRAFEVGMDSGFYSHGGLTPWRIVWGYGNIRVIGYGLPQPEVAAWRAGGRLPAADSLRYCPPERLTGGEEDLHADLFSLAAIAFELMVGRPLFDGVGEALLEDIVQSDPQRRRTQANGSPPDTLQVLFDGLLNREPGHRMGGHGFVAAVESALRRACPGPGLVDLIGPIAKAPPGWGERRGEGLMLGLGPPADWGGRDDPDSDDWLI
jgi:hypothetical protein